MSKDAVRRMLDELKHPVKVRHVCDLVSRLYLEHGAQHVPIGSKDEDEEGECF